MQKNNNLPNRILSDIELKQWCKENVPGFVDVIDRTRFKNYYKSMNPGDSLIINLDPGYKHGGTHWVALRISAEAPLVYYKDSFGAPCPAEIVDTVNNSNINRGLVYGNKINQKLKEVNCGRRAAYFLRDIAHAHESGNEIEYFDQFED